MKKDFCAVELVCFLLKCQPKDATFLYKPCFVCVATTLLYMLPYFIYAARSKWQGESQIPSFPATSVNLLTILHGCYLDGSNLTSTSQSVASRKHCIMERAFWWERWWMVGSSHPVNPMWLLSVLGIHRSQQARAWLS